jgi:cytidylate kinase
VTAKVIAIDGPAGSGKSTAARGVADALGLHTLDTGAMYRAVTLAAMEAGVDAANADAVADVAERATIDLADGAVSLDGRDVSAEIRGPEVTAAVSAVSSHPAVRTILVARQRSWVDEHGGGVVEGRDIGTVVFPDAPVKVFLTARDDVRAVRRRRDEEASEREVGVETVRDSITRRDRADSTLGRALRAEDAAPDAMVIDTTTSTVDEVVGAIVDRARSADDPQADEPEGGDAG